MIRLTAVLIAFVSVDECAFSSKKPTQDRDAKRDLLDATLKV